MASAFVSPLFWAFFFLISGAIVALSKFDVSRPYQKWVALPLNVPHLILFVHACFSLVSGWLGYRWLGSIGLLFVPLSFYVGRSFLRLRYQEQLKDYQRFLPDLLELIALCLSTGLSLPFALERLMPLLEKRSPLWAEAIAGVLAELKLGVPLETAFVHLAEHIPLPALKRISNTVGHAQNYGTQLTPLFKQMAKDMRDTHLLSVETKAQKLPVYLSVILVVFFLPSLLLVTLAPLLIRLMESLSIAFS